jgi:hypothetical protein
VNENDKQEIKQQANSVKRFVNEYKFEIVATVLTLTALKNRKLRKQNIQLIAQVGEYRRLMDTAVGQVQPKGMFDDIFGTGYRPIAKKG